MAQRGGQTNKQTDEWKISPFYRTLSPIGAAALPPPMKTKEKVEQGKGTTDHLMPLGYFLFLFFFLFVLKLHYLYPLEETILDVTDYLIQSIFCKLYGVKRIETLSSIPDQHARGVPFPGQSESESVTE